MNQTMNDDMRAPAAATVYAITGYVLAWLLGSWLASQTTDGFEDLAIGSMTILLFAPLAAAIGSLVAYFQYRPRPLDSAGRRVMIGSWIALAVTSYAAFAYAERVAAVPVVLLGLAIIVIVRLSIASRSPR